MSTNTFRSSRFRVFWKSMLSKLKDLKLSLDDISWSERDICSSDSDVFSSSGAACPAAQKVESGTLAAVSLARVLVTTSLAGLLAALFFSRKLETIQLARILDALSLE